MDYRIDYGEPRIFDVLQSRIMNSQCNSIDSLCEGACHAIGANIRFLSCRYNHAFPSIGIFENIYMAGINKEEPELMLQQYAIVLAAIEADRWCPGYLRDHIRNSELQLDPHLWEQAVCIQGIINEFYDRMT